MLVFCTSCPSSKTGVEVAPTSDKKKIQIRNKAHLLENPTPQNERKDNYDAERSETPFFFPG
jgi:hypothetical protein